MRKTGDIFFACNYMIIGAMNTIIIACGIILVLLIIYYFSHSTNEQFIDELFPASSQQTSQNNSDELTPPAGWIFNNVHTVSAQTMSKITQVPQHQAVNSPYAWTSSRGTTPSGLNMQSSSAITSITNAIDATTGYNNRTRGPTESPTGKVSASDRVFNTIGDVSTDTSKFDYKDAAAHAEKAYEDTTAKTQVVKTPTSTANTLPSVILPSIWRAVFGSNKTPPGDLQTRGGSTTVTTGTQALSPIVSQGIPVTDMKISTVVTPSGQPAGAERSDQRCGPNYDNAKCGLGRCCSTTGWCGAAGELACQASTNDLLYNGPNAIVTSVQMAPCALDCGSQAVMESAKYYYDTNSEWKDAYVMTGISGQTSGINACNIMYEYRPKSNPTQQLSLGTDRKNFIFEDAGHCNWQAMAIGGTPINKN